MGAANLIIAIQGPEPEANRRFAEAVTKQLQPLIGTDLQSIDYRADASRAFFEHNRALYLDRVELERIDDDLRKLIASKKNPAFLAFADADRGEIDDDPAKDLCRLKAGLEAREREEAFPSGYYESEDKSLLAVVAWTSSSGTGDSSGYRIRDDVQRIIDSTNPSSFGPVQAKLTGDVVSAINEHDALKSDIAWVSMVCVVLVLTVIVAYFRSIVSLGYIFFPTLLAIDQCLPPADLRALTPADLPESIKRQFRGKAGTVGRVALLFPVRVWANWDGHNLIRLADIMKNVALPDGTVVSAAGRTTLFAAMLRSVAHDGRTATAIALTAVAVTVIVLFRNIRISALVLLSLAVGLLWMGAAAALLGLKLNFLNFVTLPITFGIGIDYAVNMFARIASEPVERHPRAIAERGSAVALCSSTTIIGYSSLLIASNGALVSFGELANLGEAGCLLAALLLAPVVSACCETKSAKRPL